MYKLKLYKMSTEDNKSMLLVWGKNLPILGKISLSGTIVKRCNLSYGCRYSIPDLWLTISKCVYFIRAEKVVFAKLPPDWILILIYTICKIRRNKVEFIYITSYRPSEIWPQKMPNLARKILDLIIVQASVFTEDLRNLGFNGKIENIPLYFIL